MAAAEVLQWQRVWGIFERCPGKQDSAPGDTRQDEIVHAGCQSAEQGKAPGNG